MTDARTRRIPKGTRIIRPLRQAEGQPLPRAIGETTDRDAQRARSDADARAEWGRMVFTRNDAMACIVREDDEGCHGWQYATVGALYQDWAEIAGVALRLQHSGDGDYWTRGIA